MRTDFLLWVFYTERRKNKNNMENFLNQIHNDMSQEVLPQREKRLREKNAKCPNSKFNRICLKEIIHKEKKD